MAGRKLAYPLSLFNVLLEAELSYSLGDGTLCVSRARPACLAAQALHDAVLGAVEPLYQSCSTSSEAKPQAQNLNSDLLTGWCLGYPPA